MAANLYCNHGWHLKFTPTVPSVPASFGTAIDVYFKIKTSFYSTIMNRNEEHIYTFTGKLTGYDSSNIRPCIELAIEEDGDGWFGILTRAFGGLITVTHFIEEIEYDAIPQPDIEYTSFAQDFRANAQYIQNAMINITECNLPVIFDTRSVPVPDSGEIPKVFYKDDTWQLVGCDENPDYIRIYNWGEAVPEGSDFYFLAQYATSTWTSDVQPAIHDPKGWQGYRGTITSGTVNLKPVDGIYDGKLVYEVVTNAEFYGLEQTTDGNTWSACEELPNLLYRKRRDELGTFTYALQEDYINPIDPYDPNDPDNPTPGDDDDGDDWGDVYTRNFFTQQYILNTGGLQEISNALYDVGAGHIWENIKKGVEMFGDSPINSVVNLMYYPLDLSEVFTSVGSVSDVWFGGYQFNMQSHTALKLVYPNGYKFCGGTTIRPKFKGRVDSWRDIYATRIFIDLPYCGRYELDPGKYYDKFIKVIYYIDTRTGSCVACLVNGENTGDKNGYCLDSFNGQIGTQIPITLTDFNAFANAQINTLLGNGGQAMISGGQQASAATGALAAGSGLGVVGAMGGAAALGAIQGAKTVYGLMQNNINRFNSTRGGSTAMLNQYMNQKPRIIFEYQKMDIPDNYYDMNGGPSNYSGMVKSFNGYLECEQIRLQMPGATQSEKEKARALLMGGVYI